MGYIYERRRSDGSIAYKAEIVVRKDGKRHKLSQTFEREAVAQRWIKRREAEIRKPGGLVALQKRQKVVLGQVIDRYTADTARIGRTKAQVLQALKKHDIAQKECSDIASEDLVDLARELASNRKPQTVSNYMSHLSAVFAIAKPAWGYELDHTAMQEAMMVCKRLGLTAKSSKRGRRPTVDEMDRLMAHFEDRTGRRRALPMHHVAAFALFSSRRLEEITRLAWADYEPHNARILVRDMKHPGEKIGNDVWCELPPQARAIVDAMPRQREYIFPYTAEAISAAFTRACKVLGIPDLRFHDLRHEAVSRLFELGRTIPQVASVSGHRSWQSLQRYSHLHSAEDKWAHWEWLSNITSKDAASRERGPAVASRSG